MIIQQLIHLAAGAGACKSSLDQLRSFPDKKTMAADIDVGYWFNWLHYGRLLPDELKPIRAETDVYCVESYYRFQEECRKWILAQEWKPNWVPGAVSAAEATPIHSDVA